MQHTLSYVIRRNGKWMVEKRNSLKYDGPFANLHEAIEFATQEYGDYEVIF
jgi:hypothetical protein